jgi:threonine dehydrogenase-like Zn-dependent dehydrogenase
MPESRVGVLDGRYPRKIDIRTLTPPELGPHGELVLRTIMCGVCGSDLHRFKSPGPGEVILGHEVLGVVERTNGEWLDATGVPLQVGDLVVPETRIPCHQCEYCRGVGSRPEKLLDYSHCPNQRGLGGIPIGEAPLLSGGWSDYVELPHGAIVHRIDPAMNPDLAVLLEPFSIGMKAVRLAGLTMDDTVVVLGPGPIGLLTVVAAAEAGARTIILAGAAADAERLALGLELGAHHTIDVTNGDPLEAIRRLNRGRLATRAIDTTGTVGGFELGIAVLARGGVMVTVGGSALDAKAAISPTDLVMRQIDIRASQLGANHYESCLGVLAAGRYPLERLVTHRFDLPHVEDALRTFEQRGPCIKPVIVFA